MPVTFHCTSASFNRCGKNGNEVLITVTLPARNTNKAMVGSGGVCFWQEYGVRRSVSCWCFWHETAVAVSRREDVFTFDLTFQEIL
jgi:hypothetical protein